MDLLFIIIAAITYNPKDLGLVPTWYCEKLKKTLQWSHQSFAIIGHERYHWNNFNFHHLPRGSLRGGAKKKQQPKNRMTVNSNKDFVENSGRQHSEPAHIRHILRSRSCWNEILCDPNNRKGTDAEMWSLWRKTAWNIFAEHNSEYHTRNKKPRWSTLKTYKCNVIPFSCCGYSNCWKLII